MTKRFFLIFIVSIFYSVSNAQLETSVWYFGRNAGLDFKSENPTILTDGALDNWEGVASFSDSLGRLLFYTDGQTIWNREHEVMVNGDNLIGNHGSTESAIIVPWPESNGKYFVFVVDENGKGPLSYSVVDMTLDEGRGAVTSDKNIILEDLVVEKVTAIRHTNQKAFWLLTRVTGQDTDEDHTDNGTGTYVIEYLIDKDGIRDRKEFDVGSLNYAQADYFNSLDYQPLAVGYMRVSPNGRYIACATSYPVLLPDGNLSCVLDVYKFDPSTGIVESYLTIFDKEASLYGVEFSNDVSRLYYSTLFSVYQLDLTLPTTDEIVNSAFKVGDFDYDSFGIPNPPLDIHPWDYPTLQEYQHAIECNTPYAGALQLAINGKIYLAQNNCEYLGVINNPREKGDACNFETRGQYLGGKKSQMGLPNFIPSYFLPPNFEVANNCVNKKVSFVCTDSRDIDEYEWVISDAVGTEIYKSTERSFEYSFDKSGTYRVSLTIKIGANESSEFRFFKVYDPPGLLMPTDALLCEGDECLLEPKTEDVCEYLWSNGVTDHTLSITETSTLQLTVTNPFTQCINTGEVSVEFVKATEFSLGEDRVFCEGTSVEVKCPLDFEYKLFVWEDNSESALSRVFAKAGEYTAVLTDNNGCVSRNTINIRCNPLPIIDFRTDEVFCRDSFKVIDCNVPNAKYKWSNGETTQSIKVSKAEKYSVEVVDVNGCVSIDDIDLKEYSKADFSLIPDTLVCDDAELYLSANVPDAIDYIWQNGFHGNEILVDNPGKYVLNVVNICGSSKDSVEVSFRYCGEFVFPNIITPNGDGLNDYFKIKGLEWSSGWTMVIYNREGKEVFRSSDYRNNWNAPDVSDGVYFYIMEKNGERYKGNLSVFHK